MLKRRVTVVHARSPARAHGVDELFEVGAIIRAVTSGEYAYDVKDDELEAPI